MKLKIKKFYETQVHQIVMKLKNWNCDESQKLKLGWNSNCDETQIVIKLKNSDCDKTQKLALWWNSNFDKT